MMHTTTSQRGRVLRRLLRHRLGMFGAAVVLFYIAAALLAPVLSQVDPDAVNLRNALKPPSTANWFGTDQFGRDIFTRILYGARTSLVLGFCVVAAATSVGMVFGAMAGYFRGWVERIVVFVTDVFMTLPSIVIALAVITVLGAGLWPTIIAIAIAATPRIVRIARSAVLQVQALDFVDGARVIGAADGYILRRHVVPNSLSPVIVQGSLLMAEAVLVAAGLGFLGLGVAPPLAEWGQMLAEGRSYLRAAPFLSIFPGLATAFLVLGFNLLGDGLRDAFDVRLK